MPNVLDCYRMAGPSWTLEPHTPNVAPPIHRDNTAPAEFYVLFYGSPKEAGSPSRPFLSQWTATWRWLSDPVWLDPMVIRKLCKRGARSWPSSMTIRACSGHQGSVGRARFSDRGLSVSRGIPGKQPCTRCRLSPSGHPSPGMSGIELQRHLKASHSTVPVIFMTALEDDAIRRQAVEAGASTAFASPSRHAS